jgi:hypothetical protein
MTAHQLAALLLTLPDETIHISAYMGGNDELREVRDVFVTTDDCGMTGLTIETYTKQQGE